VAGKVLLGWLPRESRIRYGLSLWGGFGPRSFCTGQNVELAAQRHFEDRSLSVDMKRLLTFEEFKERHVESLEAFKKSSAVKAVCGDDLKKISEAYKNFCMSQYSSYKHKRYGGNSSLMF